MTQLKPCPFCGVDLIHSEDLSTRNGRCFVHPRNDDEPCIIDAKIIWDNQPEPVEAWNRRVGVDHLRAAEIALATLQEEIPAFDAYDEDEIASFEAAVATAIKSEVSG